MYNGTNLKTNLDHCDVLTAVVLTYNEAPNIRDCLESVKDFCQIFVVDSGSTDETVEICKEYTSNIYTNPYENHATQWQWALENLPIKTEWILALDADFTVTSKLKERMALELATLPEGTSGVYVRHLYQFGGGLIRFGGTKQYWLRLIKRGRAKADLSDLVDFRFIVDGEVPRWSEAVLEYNRHDDDISVWLQKQDKFSLRLAVEEELRRKGRHHWQIRPKFFGRTDERFAWLRDRWMVLPLFVRPFLYFVYRYFIALGFLDGRAGFLYHVLQGFWLRLVVDWKILQLRELGMTEETLTDFSFFMLKSPEGSIVRLFDAYKDKGV